MAGIAVAVLAFVVAHYAGWLPAPRTMAQSPPAAPAQKKQAEATVQSGVVLLPGEALVAPAPEMTATPRPAAPESAPKPRPAPATPRYAKPTPPPVVAQAPPTPAPPAEHSRDERRDSFARSVCLNCGVVTAVTRGDYDWEVRVRFDDGTRQTLRYYDRPRLQVGETFQLEDGRLIPD